MAKKRQSAQKKAKSSLLGSSCLSLQEIKPLTANQEIFFDNYDSGLSQVLIGASGTGKTFLSMYKAFEEITRLRNGFRKIVIVRSAVPTRDMGFMPGSLEEKAEVYELPYKQICNELFANGTAYEVLKKHRDIEFITTSFIRGITLNNTIILVDEFQSLNGHELESIITRAGKCSKILFSGDFVQSDLTKFSEKEGSKKFLDVLANLSEHFNINSFTQEDIVRSGMIKDFLIQRMTQFPEGI
jgi:predicted ribonuclease YlaK